MALFPFYSSFIKSGVRLLCIRRNISFCVLSPTEGAKELMKYGLTSYPFALVATDKFAVG